MQEIVWVTTPVAMSTLTRSGSCTFFRAWGDRRELNPRRLDSQSSALTNIGYSHHNGSSVPRARRLGLRLPLRLEVFLALFILLVVCRLIDDHADDECCDHSDKLEFVAHDLLYHVTTGFYTDLFARPLLKQCSM